MKNRLLIILSLSFAWLSACAQETTKEQENEQTKMDVFTSKTGTITKFVDTNLPLMKTRFDACETRIRGVTNSGGTTFFYQIVKEGKYSSNTASIEYSDLIEVIKALKSLKEEAEHDIGANADYMENKFISEDGFQVGYYVDDKKASWFIKLDRFGSENTLFLHDLESIETSFTNAKAKIDELKR